MSTAAVVCTKPARFRMDGRYISNNDGEPSYYLIGEKSPRYIASYNDLRVYKVAFTCAMEIYTFSKSWPSAEKYSLTSQIRRSSRSVCANIAEAWRKRRYPNSFVSRLSDADCEAAETEVWLEFSLSCNYIDTRITERLNNSYHHIGAMLFRMMDNPDVWCQNFKAK